MFHEVAQMLDAQTSIEYFEQLKKIGPQYDGLSPYLQEDTRDVVNVVDLITDYSVSVDKQIQGRFQENVNVAMDVSSN